MGHNLGGCTKLLQIRTVLSGFICSHRQDHGQITQLGLFQGCCRVEFIPGADLQDSAWGGVEGVIGGWVSGSTSAHYGPNTDKIKLLFTLYSPDSLCENREFGILR